MKKLIITLSALALFVSCSKSTDDTVDLTPSNTGVTPVNTNVLVQKTITTTSLTGTTSNERIYTYNGKKLVEINSNLGIKSIFTYTGNLISEIKTSDSGTDTNKEIFTYDASSRLLEYINQDLDNNSTNIYKYTYNSNATVTVKHYQNTGILTTPTGNAFETETRYFTGKELTKVEKTRIGVTDTTTLNYEYDVKNNPFMNITGMKQLMSSKEFVDDFMQGFGNSANMIKEIQLGTPNVETVKVTYTYNSDNYPTASQTTVTSALPGGATDTARTQYFYQ
ncbi:MAG: hypothetical protein QM535_05440 [Limnohabitans sp.]|nr:hypothetical protein [Limnohabitans sp.]